MNGETASTSGAIAKMISWVASMRSRRYFSSQSCSSRNAIFIGPFPVSGWRNLARFDFAAATPEHVRVAHLDPGFFKMPVDCSLVCEQQLLVGAVGDAHDVDVMKLGAAFPPVGVRHDVVPADCLARVDLALRRHGPVKQGVVASHLFAAGHGFHVFEKR